MPEETPVEPVPEPAQTHDAVAAERGEPYWQWDIPAPVTWAGPRPIDTRGPFTLSEHGGRLTLRRSGPDAEGWTAMVRDGTDDTGAIALDADQVIVAHHRSIATGCRVTAFDAWTGEVQWSVELDGVGPVEHSKYSNDVQIDVARDLVSIYGWESGGRYTERLDARTGAQVGVDRIDDALAEIPFAGFGVHEVAARGHQSLWTAQGTFVFEGAATNGEVATLARIGEDDALDWARPLPEGAGCGDSAMALIREHLFLVRYCSTSTGAQLLDLDPETGDIRVDRPLWGLGPVSHFRYFNHVKLGEVEGHPVVWGVESVGRYVEVLDLATAKTTISRTDRRPFSSR